VLPAFTTTRYEFAARRYTSRSSTNDQSEGVNSGVAWR
jgi:hypothetical protein